MKKIAFALGCSVVLFACDNASNEKAVQNAEVQKLLASGENIYLSVAGVYMDTLPCVGCQGLITELTLNPDSTYSIIQRQFLEDPTQPRKPISFRGVYEPVDNWAKLKLTSAKEGEAVKYMSIVSDGIQVLDENGNEIKTQGDYTLERIDKIVGKQNGHYIRHSVKPFERYPVQVFHRISAMDMSIHKPYLDVAPKAERALVAYYTMLFDAGCDGNNCALQNAMGIDAEAKRTLVKKWLPQLSAKAEAAASSGTREKMTLLFFVKRNNNIQVSYASLDKDDNTLRGLDEFEIGETEIKLVKSGERSNPKKPEPKKR